MDYPRAQGLWRDYGAELLRRGRREEARQALETALSLDEHDDDARRLLERTC